MKNKFLLFLFFILFLLFLINPEINIFAAENEGEIIDEKIPVQLDKKNQKILINYILIQRFNILKP